MGLFPPIDFIFSNAANVFSNNPLITAAFIAIMLFLLFIFFGVKGYSILYLGLFYLIGLAGWKNDSLGINITGIGGDPFFKIVVLFTIFIMMGLTLGILKWTGVLR